MADGREVHLGLIYPCFLGARMLGSIVFPWFFSGPLSLRTEDCLVYVFIVTGFVLSIVAYDYQEIGVLVALFCLFHACVGLLLPSFARLRTMYIPNELRGGMMSLSLAPANAAILFVLLQEFQYMAISDERQRIMPMPQDREAGLVLDYPEAVLLTNPSNPELTGEVDDKYQYSCDDKDNWVHGWICSNPAVRFWMITPSDEFRTGGPVKQDLTSHVGPTTLSMFFSTHYAGDNLTIKLRDGEPWKKVFGPVLIYLNSVSVEEDALTLWEDAKEHMLIETQSWPYDFPLSEDFPHADQRGTVSGRLQVRDKK
ncbi:unnamed protein product [Camellia sinensis]